ncbi:MAG: hypothetical protein CMH57_15590 [Myxococcales bacterium]|nr:hypothetical protein [Myxococcales bacterium]
MTDDRHDGLSTTLNKVREAYRLIHAYQRLTIDIMGLIYEELAKHGASFHRWAPVLGHYPPRSRFDQPFFAPGNGWAWDLVPGYAWKASFDHATPTHAHRIIVYIISDTGLEYGTTEPDPETFEPPERCASTVWVRVWRSAAPGQDWEPARRYVNANPGVNDGERHTLTVNGQTMEFQHITVPLEGLDDGAAVHQLVIQPILRWLGGDVAS